MVVGSLAKRYVTNQTQRHSTLSRSGRAFLNLGPFPATVTEQKNAVAYHFKIHNILILTLIAV